MSLAIGVNVWPLTINAMVAKEDLMSMWDLVLSAKGALGFVNANNGIREIFSMITGDKVDRAFEHAYNVMDIDKIMLYIRKNLVMTKSDGEIIQIEINNAQMLRLECDIRKKHGDVVRAGLTGALIATVGYDACRLVTLQFLMRIIGENRDENIADILPMYGEYYDKFAPAIRDSLTVRDITADSMKLLEHMKISDHWTGENDLESEIWYVPSLIESIIKGEKFSTNSIYLVRIICGFFVVGFAIKIYIKNEDSVIFEYGCNDGAHVTYDLDSETSLHADDFAKEGYSYIVTDSLDMTIFAENTEMMRRKTITIHHTSKVSEKSLYNAWDLGYKTGTDSELKIKYKNNKQILYKWYMAWHNKGTQKQEISARTLLIRNALEEWTCINEASATYIAESLCFTENDLKEITIDLEKYKQAISISEKELSGGFLKFRIWLYGLTLSMSTKMQSIDDNTYLSTITRRNIECPWGRPYSNTTLRLLNSIRILFNEGMHMGQALRFVSFCSAGDTIKSNDMNLENSECVAYWNGKNMCSIGLMQMPTTIVNKAFTIHISSEPPVLLQANTLGEIMAADVVPKASIFGTQSAEIVELQNRESDINFSCVVRQFYGMQYLSEKVVYEIRCKGRLVRRISLLDGIKSILTQDAVTCTCRNKAIASQNLLVYKMTATDILSIHKRIEEKFDKPYVVWVHGNDLHRAVATALCSQHDVMTVMNCLVCSFYFLEEKGKKMITCKARILIDESD